MSYEVFARKYRPQTFDDLVGQDHVARTLKNAVEQNRLAHAYLFVGPRGTGKTSTARILSKALNCKGADGRNDKPTTQPCGVCDNCKEIAQGNSLDVLEIDGASNNGVEQVRELRENSRYGTAKSRFKIYIIDEVHMLSSAAFNALLKTLEEPPPHVKFIFATTEPQKVLPTIVSRCQRFDLHRIATNLIAKQLQSIAQKEKIELENAAAHAVARAAEGGMRDAESMLDQLVAFCGAQIAEADVLSVFGLTSEFTVSQLTEQVLRSATAEALDLLHSEAESGKDMMKLMSDLISYLRDLLVFKVKPDAVADDVDPELQKCFERAAALVDPERLLELIDQFAGAEGRMKWAPNKKLHFEVAIIKAIQSLNQVTLSDVIDKLSALRDGKPAEAVPAATVAGRSPIKRAPATNTSTPPRPTTTAPAEPPVPQLDDTALWAKAVEQIAKRRPLIRGWVEAAQPLGSEGRHFVLGFPAEQRAAMESLSFGRNKDFLESVLKEIAGRECTLKFVLREDLPNHAETKPVEEPTVHAAAARKPNSQEEFRDDPLIREALEIFKGEIKS